MTANASPAVLAPVDVMRLAVKLTPNEKTGRMDYEGMVSHNFGEYVRYSDFRALAADLAAARADIAGWKRTYEYDCARLIERAEAAEADAATQAKWSRAWRNRFVSERTAAHQRDGHPYEWARAHAEQDASEFADAFDAALQEPRNGSR